MSVGLAPTTVPVSRSGTAVYWAKAGRIVITAESANKATKATAEVLTLFIDDSILDTLFKDIVCIFIFSFSLIILFVKPRMLQFVYNILPIQETLSEWKTGEGFDL